VDPDIGPQYISGELSDAHRRIKLNDVQFNRIPKGRPVDSKSSVPSKTAETTIIAA
jgi:hypothetical protein